MGSRIHPGRARSDIVKNFSKKARWVIDMRARSAILIPPDGSEASVSSLTRFNSLFTGGRRSDRTTRPRDLGRFRCRDRTDARRSPWG